jgi:translation initiation factor 3 subunit K
LLDERPINAQLDEPDPLPSLLVLLKELHVLLNECRFPAFWATYRSEKLDVLRDNYTVECVGFEDSIREVALRAVKATFTKITTQRLGTYLDLQGVHAIKMFFFLITSTDIYLFLQETT